VDVAEINGKHFGPKKMLSSIVKQHTADQVESKKENGALQTNVPPVL
jgi:hypothetical protein